ncbi:Fusaric acid resistance protein fusE [Cronobacter sakazakii 696]|nr:Fusaric acid resistance protein fusE [Cronobacter sakazakii 696]
MMPKAWRPSIPTLNGCVWIVVVTGERDRDRSQESAFNKLMHRLREFG